MPEATQNSNVGTQTPATPGTPGAAPAQPQAQPPNQLRQAMEQEKAARARNEASKALEAKAKEREELDKLPKNKDGLRQLAKRLGYDPALLGEDPAEDPVAPVVGKVAALEAKIAEFEREKEEKRFEALKQEELTRIKTSLSEKPDFSFVNAAGDNGYDTVQTYMLAHYEQTGEYMSEVEAAKVVEAKLIELAEKLEPVLAARRRSPSREQPPEEEVALNRALGRQASPHKTSSQWDPDEMNERMLDFLR